MNQVFKLILLLLFVFMGDYLYAQKNNYNVDSTIYKNVTITFKTGFVLSGTILFQNDSSLTFLANNYKQPAIISKSKIEKIDYPLNFAKIDPISFSERRTKKKKLDFTTTGLATNLSANQGYYKNNVFFVNSGGYAFTNNISINGGFELSSIINKMPNFFIAPRLKLNLLPNFALGAGYYFVKLSYPGNFDLGNLSVIYSDVTLGSKKNYISFGYGVNTNPDKMTIFSTHLYSKIYKKLGISTQYWILQYLIFGDSKEKELLVANFNIVSLSHQFDFGFMGSDKYIFGEVGLIIPYLGYTYKFNP